MEYTPERQESDRSFLVGANYGRTAERQRILDAIKEIKKRDSCELLNEIEAIINGG